MKRQIVAAAVLFSATCAFATNLIQNGSFETGNFDGMNWSWKSVGIGDTGPDNWLPEKRGFDWHNGSEFGPAFDGEYMVDLTYGNDYGGISQVLNTVVGKTYELTFALGAPNLGLQDPRQVTVQVAGLEQTFYQAASVEHPLAWSIKSMSFTATTDQTILTFLGNNVGDFWGPVIDDIRVQETGQAVPGPIAAIPFVVGLACSYRRRRKLLLSQ